MAEARLSIYRDGDIHAAVVEVDYLTGAGKARTRRWAVRVEGDELAAAAEAVCCAMQWLERPVYVHPATGYEVRSDVHPEFRAAALDALREGLANV